MLLGRSVTLWQSLVAAIAAAVIAAFNAAGQPIDLTLVGSVVAVALVVIGILANEADGHTVPTFALRRR